MKKSSEEEYLQATKTCPTCHGACQVNHTPNDWGWEQCYTCRGAGRVPKQKSNRMWIWIVILIVVLLVLWAQSFIKIPGTLVLGIIYLYFFNLMDFNRSSPKIKIFNDGIFYGFAERFLYGWRMVH